MRTRARACTSDGTTITLASTNAVFTRKVIEEPPGLLFLDFHFYRRDIPKKVFHENVFHTL